MPIVLQKYKVFLEISAIATTTTYHLANYHEKKFNRFIQDSSLFRVWFKQVYTGF
jgi:hypothetical protein